MELRPYQKEAVQAVHQHWQEWDRELLVMATGTGKTATASQIIRDRKPYGRSLFLVHREELIQQFRDRFGEETGKIKADENTILPVTAGSVQTMYRRQYAPDLFQTIVVDEAHHATSDSYQEVLQQFPTAKVLGLTATPSRQDKKDLGAYFEGIAYEYGLRRAVSEGYLCKITAQTIPLNIDLSNVKISVGDFQVDSIAETLEPYLPEIAEAIKNYAKDRKTIVFLPLISIAQQFRDLLIEHDIDAREVNGMSADRQATLEWFDKAGKGSVLCNAMLLTEGVDIPSCDCVVVLRPTKVTSLYTQMVGRGTRLYPGKKDLLLLDFLWMTTKHDLCRPANLVTENKEDREHIKRQTESAQIDLFDACTDAEEARRNALAEALRAQKRKKAKLIDPLQYFVSINQIDMEDYEPSFAWEIQPATTKQMQMLENWGINPDGMNKGRASMIIDKLLTRREQGMATPKQIRLLERQGYDNVGEWTFDRASKKIGQLASVGWQRWRLHD